MKTRIYRFISYCSLFWLIPTVVQAQTGTGSLTTDNSVVVISEGHTEYRFSETSYFGPDARWEINGTLEIWSKNIWIAPEAVFTGSGSIILHNPGENPAYIDMADGPTVIDGNNGTFTGVKVELRNRHGMRLADVTDPGYQTANPDGPLAAALKIGNSLNLSVDHAHVTLNGHDLIFGPDAAILNYNSRRMVITDNNVRGHMVKVFNGPSTFLFPVGIIAEDYTPVTLAPAAGGTMAVSAQDYTPSLPVLANKTIGMDRSWHIYAAVSGVAQATLQHNSITNATGYNDANARINQYTGNGNWEPGNTIVQSTGVHQRSNIQIPAAATDPGSWFTKLARILPRAHPDILAVTSGAPTILIVLDNDEPGTSPIAPAGPQIVVRPTHGTLHDNGDGTFTYTPNERFTGTDRFTYRIQDEEGQWSNEADVTITVAPGSLLIPNVFTPNGDGKNDRFVVTGLEAFDSAVLQVFNRWGNEVFHSADYRNNWDGGNLNEGSYYYRLVLKKNGKDTQYKGWVLIKR